MGQFFRGFFTVVAFMVVIVQPFGEHARMQEGQVFSPRRTVVAMMVVPV